MYSRLDDIIALVGFVLLTVGIYLWLGLPAALITTGIVLVYIGVRLDVTPKAGKHESD